MPQEFVDGLFVKRGENAPEFVKASLSFKVDKFGTYLISKANASGYVNIDILESKEGKLYAKLNDWKPDQKEEQKEEVIDIPEEPSEDINIENIPF